MWAVYKFYKFIEGYYDNIESSINQNDFNEQVKFSNQAHISLSEEGKNSNELYYIC